MHFHFYSSVPHEDLLRLGFHEQINTYGAGIPTCLGLQAVANVELEEITRIPRTEAA